MLFCSNIVHAPNAFFIPCCLYLQCVFPAGLFIAGKQVDNQRRSGICYFNDRVCAGATCEPVGKFMLPAFIADAKEVSGGDSCLTGYRQRVVFDYANLLHFIPE